MALYIKNNIDLKELEKFGFEKADSLYTFYEYKGKWGIGLSRKITPLVRIREEDLGIIFDLIQAGLVEKVVE